jgi:hypothetical protein
LRGTFDAFGKKCFASTGFGKKIAAAANLLQKKNFLAAIKAST